MHEKPNETDSSAKKMFVFSFKSFLSPVLNRDFKVLQRRSFVKASRSFLLVKVAQRSLPTLMQSVVSRGCPRGVMVKAMHCGIVVREFVLQSRYYVHFRANTLGKGMNPLILPPAMGK